MNIPAHLDKHAGSPSLLNMDSYTVRDIGTTWGGTIAARYFKGLGADGDNLVIVAVRSVQSIPSAEPSTTLTD